MSDKYDEAVAFLTDNPNQIYGAWSDTTRHPHGCLFQFVGRGGCLTMIRNGWHGDVSHPELTEQIRADCRIPTANIMPADLPVFAEWQRRIDRELNRI